MRRVSTMALLIVLAAAGLFAVGGLSPGVALAQDKPAATPVDIFITPVFWIPYRSDFRAYGWQQNVTRETPQGGLQLGLRYGNFSFGVSGLWMSEENRLDGNTPGEEFKSNVNFDRYDLDFSGAYTFRDVIKDRLSLSTGLGLFTAHVQETETCDFNCSRDERARDHRRYYFWAVGPSLGATIRLADRWYLGANAAAAWGEINVDQGTSASNEVHRQPSNSSAFFTRSDALIRFLLSDTVSLFAGYKVQYVSSPGTHDLFWHGPTFGLTVRYNIQ